MNENKAKIFTLNSSRWEEEQKVMQFVGGKSSDISGISSQIVNNSAKMIEEGIDSLKKEEERKETQYSLFQSISPFFTTLITQESLALLILLKEGGKP